MIEITVEIPEVPQQDLDREHLKKLVFSAVAEALEDLKNLNVPHVSRTVYRGDDLQMKSVQVSVPFCRDRSVWDRIDILAGAPAATSLTDYLWEKGAFKKTFTGPAPDKATWARSVYGDLVHGPILGALNDSEIEEAVKTGSVTPWQIPENILRLFIESTIEDKLLQKECQRTQRAICFLPMLDLEAEADFVLGLGITIKALSVTDRLIYMTKYQSEYIWNDFDAPWMAKFVVEIELSESDCSIGDEQSFANRVGERLDLLKWALMEATGSTRPPKEGKIFVIDRRGSIRARYQRDLSASGFIGPISSIQIKTASKLVESLNELADNYDAVSRAIWHYGRACNTPLDRDVVLESAIGIDALMVEGGGDSKYRFWLHAGAVLSAALPKAKNVDYFETAKRLYDNRSKLAHGAKAKALETKHANEARSMLSMVLRAILILDKSGRLPKDKGMSMPKRVEAFVMGRLAMEPAALEPS